VFLSHFSKIFFEKGLFRQFQRLALLASVGFGGKKPKGELAFGAESPQVWATYIQDRQAI